MTTADPAAFDPDDERLSRFLDDDLDVEEVAALAGVLRDDPVLQARLELFREVGEHVRDVAPAGDDALDAMVAAALAAFDETFHVKHREDPPVPEATRTDHTDHTGPPARPAAASGGAPVARLEQARRRRRWFRSANALGLSAAAALVLVVAIAALTTRFGPSDGDGGDSVALSETAATTFADQRATAEAASERADAAPLAASDTATEALSDASGAGSTAAGGTGPSELDASPPTTPAALGAPYRSMDALLSAIRQGTLQPGVVPPSTTVACDPVAANGAIVDGQLVLWGVREAGDGERIVVLDAATCTVLRDEPR